jgi:hypothetical protein
VKAMEHFASHIAAAEAKGAPKDVIAKYKQMMIEANDHLTNGQAQLPETGVAPAAAMGGGGRMPSVAREKMLQENYTSQTPDQSALIGSVAAPPRPSTAG